MAGYCLFIYLIKLKEQDKVNQTGQYKPQSLKSGCKSELIFEGF